VSETGTSVNSARSPNRTPPFQHPRSRQQKTRGACATTRVSCCSDTAAFLRCSISSVLPLWLLSDYCARARCTGNRWTLCRRRTSRVEVDATWRLQTHRSLTASRSLAKISVVMSAFRRLKMRVYPAQLSNQLRGNSTQSHLTSQRGRSTDWGTAIRSISPAYIRRGLTVRWSELCGPRRISGAPVRMGLKLASDSAHIVLAAKTAID